jgi:hypothetical protein
MFVLVLAACTHIHLRETIRTIAADHGLIETLPMVYHGRATSHRVRALSVKLRNALERRRGVHVEVITVTDRHFLQRSVFRS